MKVKHLDGRQEQRVRASGSSKVRQDSHKPKSLVQNLHRASLTPVSPLQRSVSRGVSGPTSLFNHNFLHDRTICKEANSGAKKKGKKSISLKT